MLVGQKTKENILIFEGCRRCWERDLCCSLLAVIYIYMCLFVCVSVCLWWGAVTGSGSLSDGGTGGWALMRTRRRGILFLPRRCGIRAARMFQNEKRRFIWSAGIHILLRSMYKALTFIQNMACVCVNIKLGTIAFVVYSLQVTVLVAAPTESSLNIAYLDMSSS